MTYCLHTAHAGGQEWRDISNFVEDFSVTTNGLRTPKKALEVAGSALNEVFHYPSPSDVQYKEYERSAENNGLQLRGSQEAELVCVVNPCNPTGDWAKKLYDTRGIKVFVIQSWTKIWACPGLRVGSLLAPHPDEAKRIRKHQVPWSLNTLAIAFLSEVVKDTDYMNETWTVTPQWNDVFRSALQNIRPDWDVNGHR
ncbi:aminotransferase, class I/II superfamily protein [Besnoitia besnoiti]|uniref:Aminotransferase, class I/II superfamily protein n=1 Tax=Besnoitia besnoiti TaxID=94643 RepID=A0A2A9MDP2_BESBE|nr:aminotransferase, class I/II superfamily protein [Besnoitia besnoiti]PFH34066.1 aminotransferase, class I/II superfamily protein [Besnoitia besnoiti]